jgi:hypothetical protein
MNRGNAYQHAQDLTSAINDYGVAITIQTLIRDTVLHRGEWSSDLQFALASAHVNRGIAFAVSNNAHSVTADWGVALSILRLLANEQPDVSVDVQRLLANWFMLGKGLTTDHVRLALFNLKRLIGRFDAQTLSLLEIPKFNGQIANGLRSVRPALTFAQINAVHAALLGTA